jgi:hypothetical protein
MRSKFESSFDWISGERIWKSGVDRVAYLVDQDLDKVLWPQTLGTIGGKVQTTDALRIVVEKIER